MHFMLLADNADRVLLTTSTLRSALWGMDPAIRTGRHTTGTDMHVVSGLSQSKGSKFISLQ